MDYHKSKQEQWDSNHLKSTDDNYVTGASIEEVASYHGFEVPKSKTVLEIGIGKGYAIKDLYKLGNKAIAVDVSPVALHNVFSFADGTYLSENLSEIKPVDLAFSHLVFQHNHEYEVARMINDVQLTVDGFFSFQFATLVPGKTVLSELIINDINKSMLYFYSVDKMKDIIKRSNKELVSVSEPRWFPEPFSFEWNIFKVRNGHLR